jgi:protein-tyrosine phosphatase
MVRMAAENGTTDLVATPHANHEYNFDPELIGQRIEEIGAASQGVLKLHRGCDFHLSYENIEDAVSNPTKYAINGAKYLLVEFSDILIFHNTGEIFGRFLDAGLFPIITHPERNALLRKKISDISAWVEAGVCVQVTAQSLTGDFGKNAQSFSRDLLDKGLVHFIASDAHDCEHRPPRLDQASAWLARNYGHQIAEMLCETNPRAALTGAPVDSIPAEGRSSSGSWLKFWR